MSDGRSNTRVTFGGSYSLRNGNLTGMSENRLRVLLQAGSWTLGGAKFHLQL